MQTFESDISKTIYLTYRKRPRKTRAFLVTKDFTFYIIALCKASRQHLNLIVHGGGGFFYNLFFYLRYELKLSDFYFLYI